MHSIPLSSSLSSASWKTLTIYLILLSFSYWVSLVIYRLFFSPIANFPGPKLAAATGWTEFYYDVVKPGMYIFEIEKMHAKYGPIVRVNPTELSINDPDFYDDVYVFGNVRKSDKHAEFCQGTGLEGEDQNKSRYRNVLLTSSQGSALLTHEHDLHRKRRRVLDPFFSRFAIRKMEPLFVSLLIHFEQRLKAVRGKVIRLDHAFVAFSGDLIRSITCENIDLLMDDDEWSYDWFNLFQAVVKSAPLFTSFPWIIKIISYVPISVLTWMYPRGSAFVEFKNIARNHIVQAKQDKLSLKMSPSDSESLAVIASDSIFRKIVNLDLPESELDTDRLAKEAQALFGAATVAVARALDNIAYYVVASPKIRDRLGAELAGPMSDYPERFPAFSQLEKLPYLTAVVQEGLRLSYGSMHRMPRVFPNTALQYKEWTIPPNVPVGMSAYLNHTNPSIFIDPFAFDPDRWLGETPDPRMKKALTPFTRGSRGCLGKNLATTELYMMTAMLFRPPPSQTTTINTDKKEDNAPPRFEWFETDESDVKSVHDFMIPLPRLDSRGLRAFVW